MAKVNEKYELLYIIDIDKSEEETAAIVAKFKALIEANGTLSEHDEWGKRKLAYLINDKFTPSYIKHTPIITDAGTFSFDDRRPLYRYVYFVERDQIFEDLFKKINTCI